MTAAELVALWQERDERYGTRRVASGLFEVDDKMTASVRAWRVRETADLPPRERGKLAMEALAWTPPAPLR